MITTTISSKNQITIPRYILSLLAIKNQDKLLIELEEKTIKISPMGNSIIDDLGGSIEVSNDKKGIPFNKVLDATKKIMAKKLTQS